MVRMKCRKSPLFVVIIIAVKVIDRPFKFQKWRSIKGHTCREGRIEEVTQYWPTQCSMQYTSLRLKLGDHEGLSLFVRGSLLKRTLLLVLLVILIQILIHSVLTPVPVYFWGQSGTSWCCLAADGGTLATRHPTPANSVSGLHVLFYFSYY